MLANFQSYLPTGWQAFMPWPEHPRTSKASLESSGRVMCMAPQYTRRGSHRFPWENPVPLVLIPSAPPRLLSSLNSDCHQAVFEAALRAFRWLDTSPDLLFQRQRPPSDDTQAWKRSLITKVTCLSYTHMHCPKWGGPWERVAVKQHELGSVWL